MNPQVFEKGKRPKYLFIPVLEKDKTKQNETKDERKMK